MSSLSAQYPSVFRKKDKPVDAASGDLRELISAKRHVKVKKFVYHGNTAKPTKDNRGPTETFLDAIGALKSLVEMEFIFSGSFPPMRFCNALSNSNHTLKSLILKATNFTFGTEINRSVIQSALPNCMPSLETFECGGGNGLDMLTWAT
ncbi:MAG: hypothetical protein SGILL_005769, partial [Bacillariaceae sp.]